MKDIIEILKQNINNHSESRSRDIELLIKARAIEILRPMAESGIGFAMESIAKIASSTSGKSGIQASLEDLTQIVALSLEKGEQDNEKSS